MNIEERVTQVVEQIEAEYRAWKREKEAEGETAEQRDTSDFIASSMFEYAREFKGNAEALQDLVCAIYDLEADLIAEDTLGAFKRVFNIFNQLQEPFRSQQLGRIMSEMEAYYNIPMFKNEKYNEKNKDVMELYHEILAARNI